MIAVAINDVNPKRVLRPPSPASLPAEAHNAGAGLTLTNCGRHAPVEAQPPDATAEPGHFRREAHDECAGLTFFECGRQPEPGNPLKACDRWSPAMPLVKPNRGLPGSSIPTAVAIRGTKSIDLLRPHEPGHLVREAHAARAGLPYFQLAVAIRTVKPTSPVRPHEPGHAIAGAHCRRAGLIYSDCGRHLASARMRPRRTATAEPDHENSEAQRGVAGLTHSDCGRRAKPEAHRNRATAEPGQCSGEAQCQAAGLIFHQCGRQDVDESPDHACDRRARPQIG